MPNPVASPADFCLTPRWPLPASVQSAFSLREGGVSTPPYTSLNLGSHVGDDNAAVMANRQRWAQALGTGCTPYLEQVHGIAHVELAATSPSGLLADAAWTQTVGVACTVLVADCLPVLFCDRGGQKVAAAHAGWRGLAGDRGIGVLESTLAVFERPADVMAWLGPCIGPTAFEVGDEVRTAFISHQAQAGACFQPGTPGKWWADLAGLARLRLSALGVNLVYGNDSSASWCTFNNPLHFFSFRRDRVCGRMAASIWRTT